MMSRPGMCWRWSKGVAGEAYILGGENLMLRELLGDDRAPGRAPGADGLRLPIAPLMPLAWVMERVAERHRQDRR